MGGEAPLPAAQPPSAAIGPVALRPRLATGLPFREAPDLPCVPSVADAHRRHSSHYEMAGSSAYTVD